MDLRSLGDLAGGETLRADICIVGSGPAGATLLRELANSRLSVLVVESGQTGACAFADSLNEIENIGAERAMDQTIVRNRILGGTSLLWTGRCANLDEIDYQARAWVPHSGWPLRPEEMLPYLDRSAAHLGLGFGSGYTQEGFWQLTGRVRPEPHIDTRSLLPFFWQFSRRGTLQEPMRFGPRILSERDAPNTRVLTGATAVHVNTDPQSRAFQSLEVAAQDDRRWTIHAPRLVLCTGGIENARLLLASRRICPQGVGNGHDLVGRFLMDHPRGGVARFDHRKAASLEPHFGLHTVRTRQGTNLFCQGLRLSPAAQQAEGLLNCAVWLSELVAPDDPWSAIRRIAGARADWRRDPLDIARNGLLMARGLDRMLRRGGGPIRKLLGLELNCIVEQRPDPDSRVMLARRLDAHGLPLPLLDWQISEQEQRTVRRTAELVVSALQAVGIQPPVLEDWVAAGQGFVRSFSAVAHHIGTTRMSDDPRSGVVDAQCQVHGVEGLFIAGSSVFPTAGHANPTQMIVAMAIRLADHLKQTTSAAALSRQAAGWPDQRHRADAAAEPRG